jgi:glycosyltransferase involved in cell wall biosynthesis
MNSLYNHPKVKAHVSFTKGEGFGRPLLEASVTGKPIIVSKHSGHMDFLEHVIWIPGTLTNIHPSAQWKGVLNEGTKWFTCEYPMAGGLIRDVYENYKNYTDLGKRQAYKSKTEFNLDKMAEKLLEYLDIAASKIPKKVELKLPKLKKIELPKLETVTEEVKDGK